ncbi:hypothetical protein ElyMa_002976800 [Elysia marginata]|uniref:Uncharacterized protein n=1 Tax=Elysia marginata TaxID=1093978 RepID=A0AAV4ID19_9GAST|nr:hypothetical protein ElyMa_002976800 [Elysia marginata]
MLEFHYDFLGKYIDRKDYRYQLFEIDTDSLYILYLALSKETPEDVVRPNIRKQFANEWDGWFPAEACKAQKAIFKEQKAKTEVWDNSHCQRCRVQRQFDKRTPGLLKTEFSGEKKTYYCCSEDGIDKFSSKGLNKSYLEKKDYKDVLKNRKSGGCSNYGFKTDGVRMLTYVQQRDVLSYLYIKSVVHSDGVTTSPIRL